MKKKSFILYCDTYENIRELTFEDKGKLLDAMFNHALDNEVKIDGVVGMAFNFIKRQMDRDLTKYEIYLEKQRANGSKGGRPKKTQDNPNNPSLVRLTQKSLNDTDNVTATDNVNNNYMIEEAQQVAPPPKKSKRKTGKRFCDSMVTMEWIDWAKEEFGWSEKKIVTIGDNFSDYWNAASGQKATKLDWLATWRMWCRKQNDGWS